MSLQEILAQQPQGGAAAEEDDLGFIGMPKGYVPTRPGYGGPVSPGQAERLAAGGRTRDAQITPPKYKVGAEMEPRSYPPEMIARLQQQLAAAGLIGPSTRYRLGVWDSTSTNAYKQLLAHANRGGMSREDALTELLSAPQMKGLEGADGVMGGVGGSAAPQGRLNTYEASDPAGVRQTAEQAFRQALGRKPRKDELEKFTAAFLGRERQSQEVVFAAQQRLEEANAAAAAGGATGDQLAGGNEAEILWQRVQQMIADSPYKITPGARSRDYATQVRLWNDYQAGRGPKAARPGTSKHGDGRANDLQYSSPAARQWALENAHKYGLHFPIYDPKLPRSRDESWHVEVLGGAGAGHSVGDGHDHAAMTAAVGAPTNENVTVQRQDVGAQAIEFARAQNPNETAAYDIGQQFNSFLSIMSKGVV